MHVKGADRGTSSAVGGAADLYYLEIWGCHDVRRGEFRRAIISTLSSFLFWWVRGSWGGGVEGGGWR